MRSRAFRSIAVLLGMLLLANTPAQAGPVTIGDVIQIFGNYQNPPALRLTNVSQTSSAPVAGVTASIDRVIDSSTTSGTSDSLLTGIALDGQDPQKTVTIVTQGDVELTVCDCGEVTVAAGFPKWPLLFLAAIPLFFIKDDDGDDSDKVIPGPTPTPTSTPAPTPTPAPIPEPASLLLFGSGLAAFGASLRRRRLKAKLKTQGDTTEEG
ncbi:MAG TPA: PEP-CTERM sorting domain-containing protein [Pyrinomonadaceae bacterium]|nr:PEP-CTERM sorting domain-containing protein [Pyrinomonadaceae bacterium]